MSDSTPPAGPTGAAAAAAAHCGCRTLLLTTIAAGVLPFSRQRTASRWGLLPLLLPPPLPSLPMAVLLLSLTSAFAPASAAGAGAGAAAVVVVVVVSPRMRLVFRGLACCSGRAVSHDDPDSTSSYSQQVKLMIKALQASNDSHETVP
jgi:hypothetical protein